MEPPRPRRRVPTIPDRPAVEKGPARRPQGDDRRDPDSGEEVEVVELEPDTPAPTGERRPSRTDFDGPVDTWPADEPERDTEARTRAILARGPRERYPESTPSLRTVVGGFQRWLRQYYWIAILVGASGGSFALNRLWEVIGLETKANADRREERIMAAIDGGAHDSRAREALDGGAHDSKAREAIVEGLNASAADARSARASASRAAALAGVDAGLVELDAGTTVTPR